MNSNTVNISFRRDLLKQIDRLAKEESRSRSELIREAARMYIENKKKWQAIFDYGSNISRRKQLTEKDVISEIARYRKSKRVSS